QAEEQGWGLLRELVRAEHAHHRSVSRADELSAYAALAEHGATAAAVAPSQPKAPAYRRRTSGRWEASARPAAAARIRAARSGALAETERVEDLGVDARLQLAVAVCDGAAGPYRTDSSAPGRSSCTATSGSGGWSPGP